MGKPKPKMQWVNVTPGPRRSPSEYFKMGFTAGCLSMGFLFFMFLLLMEKK